VASGWVGDLYGAHAGARIANEIALTRPDRARKLVLDGLYAPDDLDEILRTYAPELVHDLRAAHLMWTWHFVRDQHLFFPWFKRDVAHRYVRDMPDPARMHALFLEVAKAVRPTTRATARLSPWATPCRS
jgi:pimeloyl-ACP methyl ester carboxylesterase